MAMLNVMPRSQEVAYLFVDGGCLWRTIERYNNRYPDMAPLDIDFDRLRTNHRKAFFYDAIPVRAEGEDATVYEDRIAAKTSSLNIIARKDGFHVRTGDVRKRRRVGNEQKMVDVQLTVDMLSMAQRGIFSRTTLITGDLDFKPLLDALVAMGIDVCLMYPPGETNNELIEAADVAIPLTVQEIVGWLSHKILSKLDLPSGCYVFLNDEGTGELTHSWVDPKFGRCTLRRQDDNFRLDTTNPSDMNPTHKLSVTLKDLRRHHQYIEDLYGLRIPL